MDPHATYASTARQVEEITTSGTISSYDVGLTCGLTPTSTEKDEQSYKSDRHDLTNSVSQSTLEKGNAIQPTNYGTISVGANDPNNTGPLSYFGSISTNVRERLSSPAFWVWFIFQTTLSLGSSMFITKLQSGEP
jgi:hypothetical protein